MVGGECVAFVIRAEGVPTAGIGQGAPTGPQDLRTWGINTPTPDIGGEACAISDVAMVIVRGAAMVDETLRRRTWKGHPDKGKARERGVRVAYEQR